MTVPAPVSGVVQSLFRAVIGLLFLCHGTASLFGVLGGNQGSGHSIPAGTWPGWWAALIQMIGGALVLVGLGTRAAALISSGSMAYAYFSVHQEHALLPIRNGGELAVLFCWSMLVIAVTGPGPYSVDALLSRATRRRVAEVPELAGERQPATAG